VDGSSSADVNGLFENLEKDHHHGGGSDDDADDEPRKDHSLAFECVRTSTPAGY
jgi:hypothetical protein